MKPHQRVLILAPHADDESLGVGGTVRRHMEDGDHVTVAVITGPGSEPHPVFRKESFAVVQDEARAAARILGSEDLRFLNLQAVTFPQEPVWKTNAVIQELVQDVEPEILYVPFAFDLHEDHRAVHRAASVAWRSSSQVGRNIKTVLSYEVQSETHWNSLPEPGFTPNIWHALSEDQLEAKLEALECYQSQMSQFPHARSTKAVEHLARWRGSQQGYPAAEAFLLVKGIW